MALPPGFSRQWSPTLDGESHITVRTLGGRRIIMAQPKIEAVITMGRYISFKYRKVGESNHHVRFVWPQAIKDHLLIAKEYTPDERFHGKRKSFKIDLIEDLKVMPEGWSPGFEWRERKHVDGDVVVDDRTTLKDRRDGCAGKIVIRHKRGGLLRWLLGD